MKRKRVPKTVTPVPSSPFWLARPLAFDVANRAVKTGVQAALAMIPAEAIFDLGLDGFQVAAIAGLSAAASVVHNALLRWASS